ncbi:MAG: hypothetical protein R3E84_05290 [Pseudomonadales bacterium]
MIRQLLTSAVVLFATPILAGDPLSVCIGPDGAMRLIETGFFCKKEETLKKFTEWEPGFEDKREDPEVTSLRSRLETAERRLGRLDSKLQALEFKNSDSDASEIHSLKAPFEVTGKAGKVILRVTDEVDGNLGGGAQVTIASSTESGYGLRVYNSMGLVVGGIVESNGGGFAAVRDASNRRSVVIDGPSRRVSVFDDSGVNAVAGLAAESRGGVVGVYDQGKPIAYLTRSQTAAGGNVTTLHTSGASAFSAGATAAGGGEACVNRMTASGERGTCLGIALPGGLNQ